MRLGEQLREEIEKTKKKLDALEEMSAVQHGLMQDFVDNIVEKDQRKKEVDLFSLAVEVVERIYNDIPERKDLDKNIMKTQEFLSEKIDYCIKEMYGELREPYKSYSISWADSLSTGLFYGRDRAITMLLNNVKKRTPNFNENPRTKAVLDRLHLRYDARS